ncbi:MAG: cytochrome c [Hydrogenophilaceae bacterium]|nr:cytochrome c [Hydrogenophilaceae bacterium]
MKHAISKVLLLGVAAGFAMAALAADDEEVIKYRKNVMKAYGAHMAAAGAIVQGKVKGQLAGHAKALEATTQDMAGMFPAGSDFGETNALDAVWSKRADFEKKAKDTQAKAAAFAKAAAGSDAAAKFKDLSDSCKACHKDYRKEQK